MPVQEISHRRQLALLWAATGLNDARARPIVSLASQEVGVRWVGKQSQALDPTGNTVRVDATVVVDVDVPIGSIMWQGGYDDLETALPGTGVVSSVDVPLSDLMEVLTFNTTKDLKGRAATRTVGLVRLTDSMPEQG